jgi:hypothetical protein
MKKARDNKNTNVLLKLLSGKNSISVWVTQLLKIRPNKNSRPTNPE